MIIKLISAISATVDHQVGPSSPLQTHHIHRQLCSLPHAAASTTCPRCFVSLDILSTLCSIMQPDITEYDSSPSSSQLSSTAKRPAGLSSVSRSLSTSKTNVNVAVEERPYELESLYRDPPPSRPGHTPPWLVRASESFGRTNPRLYGWARKSWLYVKGPRPKVDLHRMSLTGGFHM